MWVKFALIYSVGGKHTIPFSLGANFNLIYVTLVTEFVEFVFLQKKMA